MRASVFVIDFLRSEKLCQDCTEEREMNSNEIPSHLITSDLIQFQIKYGMRIIDENSLLCGSKKNMNVICFSLTHSHTIHIQQYHWK